jgi:hypothetical protein
MIKEPMGIEPLAEIRTHFTAKAMKAPIQLGGGQKHHMCDPRPKGDDPFAEIRARFRGRVGNRPAQAGIRQRRAYSH